MQNLRLFVNTLTDDDKCSVLYRDNLMQPIQILLPRKQKSLSEFFAAFLISTLNYEHFHKKDDPNSRCISRITFSEKGYSINLCKISFKRFLPQKTWQTGPKTVEICKTPTLPYLFFPMNIIQFEKAYVSAMENLKPVC